MSQPATEEFETLRQSLGFELPGTTGDGIARARALMARLSAERTPTSLVSYESKGQVLVIARDGAGHEAADSLGEGVGVTVLITDSTAPTAADGTQTGVRHATFYAPLKTLSGHLGDFHAVVEAGEREVALGETLGREKTSFDIVLDLLDPPSIGWEVPPPGYYAPRGDEKVLALALEEIPQMVGEFEKPKFFRYDPDICAHGANGLRGCTRCIDRCPTMAIASVGERIEVDPFLCQGAGSCATACPTGAISYAYPTAADNLAALRDSLRVYREAGGVDPVVLFYDMAQGLEWLTAHASRLPERVLPYAVEEIGSVGPDIWLSALAYGATRVALLRTPGRARAGGRGAGRATLFYTRHAARFGAADGRAWNGGRGAGCRVHGVCRPADASALAGKLPRARRETHHYTIGAGPSLPRDRVRRGVCGAPRKRPLWRARGARGLHAVHGLRVDVSNRGLGGGRRFAAAQLHRDELRPMRSVRDRMPRRCDYAKTTLLV